MAKSYTNTALAALGPTRLQRILLGAVCLLAASLIASACASTWRWFGDNSEATSTPMAAYGPLDDLLNKSRFQQAYLTANGGSEMLKKMQTIRVSGWVESEGARQRFVSVKKRPDKSLLTLQFENYDLSFGVNGKTAWQRVTLEGQEPQVELLEQKEAAALIDSAQFFGPVMRALLFGDGQISNLKPAIMQGQECILVDIKRREQNTSMQIYVDHSTMHVLARIETFADGKIRKILYGNYQKLEGMNEAFHIESYLNDALQSRIIIEHGTTNFGVLSKVFDMPQISPED